MPSSACTLRSPPSSTLFPYTTLFRSKARLDPRQRELLGVPLRDPEQHRQPVEVEKRGPRSLGHRRDVVGDRDHGVVHAVLGDRRVGRDRKSTRLNSSHRCISYAVFCLHITLTTLVYPLSLHDALPI